MSASTSKFQMSINVANFYGIANLRNSIISTCMLFLAMCTSVIVMMRLCGQRNFVLKFWSNGVTPTPGAKVKQHVIEHSKFFSILSFIFNLHLFN